MSDWLNAPHSYSRVTIPTIWVALAVSLLLHIAVLWVWLPRVHLPSLKSLERGNASGPLVVELAPQPEATTAPPAPPSVPALQAQPLPTRRQPSVEAGPRPSSTPSVTVLGPAPAIAAPPPFPSVAAPPSAIVLPPATSVAEPAPTIALPPATLSVATPAPAITAPPPPPSVAAPASPSVEGDLSSYIEARRRARGQAAPAPPRESPAAVALPIEDEKERSNRIIAANLGLRQTPTVGYDPKGGGGIFQIQRMSYDAAEFIFFGWNRDIRRNSKQLIEVAKGDHSDIRIAVVRRMIAIIRADESGDFVWVSQRLGRNVTLSARPSDNAELEDFLMQEFFADPRWPN